MIVRKKILLIHHGQGVGGGLIALLGLIEELKIQYDVEVFSIFDSIANEYIENLGVKVLRPKSLFYTRFYTLFIHSEASYISILGTIRNFKNFLLYFLSKYFFAKIELMPICQDKEIIYLNSTFISEWSYSAKSFNKKVVIHIREPLSKGLFGLRYNCIRNTILKNCDRIICVSKDNLNRLNIKKKSIVVYDPVVIKNRSNEVRGKDKDDDLKYFVYLGGEMRIKGFEQFVKCLKYLNNDIRIYFLGTQLGEDSKILKKTIKILLDPYNYKLLKLQAIYKNSNNIIEIGMTDNVIQYYKNSLAMIAPFSKPHACLPILESFSLSKPVIVSDIAGMNEIVNEQNGLFFKNKQSKILAEKINFYSSLSLEQLEQKSQDAYLTYKNLRDGELSVSSILNEL